MSTLSIRGRLPALATLLSAAVLSGCVGAPEIEEVVSPLSYGPSQECLARAMFFESNRSSREGMLAVGTVVMNRVGSPSYPDSVCDVVAQPKQFAPGVMTRDMGAGKELAMQNNMALLQNEQWIDIPIAYASGRRALMSIEKGVPGDRVFKEAIEAWKAKT